MSYSLNEIEGMARRAARGAGYSWGLAEETGKAVRWLCANGLDGCATLARLFEQTGTVAKNRLAPLSLTVEWAGASGRLCPLTAGAALSDCADRLGKHDIVMHDVLCPVLVVPFAAAAAKATGNVVALGWGGQTVICDAFGGCGAVAPPALATSVTGLLRIEPATRAAPALPSVTRANPGAAAWAALGRFGQRTYAPATKASRLLGAGAALCDND